MVEAGGIAGPGSIGLTQGGGRRHDAQFFPVEELARDERFHKITMRDRMADPRVGRRQPERRRRAARSTTGSAPERKDASDAAARR